MFRFSLAIPEGWQLKPVGADGKATHVAKNVPILMVRSARIGTNAVRAPIDGDKNFHSELVRDT
jgi:hypothetical protein